MSRDAGHDAADRPAIPSRRAAALRQVFESSPLEAHLGMRVEEVRLDYARLNLPLRQELLQATGTLHGGVITSLLDSTAAVAVLSAFEQRPRKVATVDLHLHFLSPAREGELVAEAEVLRRGRSMIYLRAEAWVQQAQLVAAAQLAFHVVP